MGHLGMNLTRNGLIVLITIIFVAGVGTAYAGIVLPTITLAGNVVITGDTEPEGKLLDTNDDAGTAGEVLSSTETGIDWIGPSKIQKQEEIHIVMMIQFPENQFVHHTFSCTNDGVFDGAKSWSTVGTDHGDRYGIRIVQPNGVIDNVVISDDFKTVDFDSKRVTRAGDILTVTLRCLSIVP